MRTLRFAGAVAVVFLVLGCGPAKAAASATPANPVTPAIDWSGHWQGQQVQPGFDRPQWLTFDIPSGPMVPGARWGTTLRWDNQFCQVTTVVVTVNGSSLTTREELWPGGEQNCVGVESTVTMRPDGKIDSRSHDAGAPANGSNILWATLTRDAASRA
jgi:hypothetical protein